MTRVNAIAIFIAVGISFSACPAGAQHSDDSISFVYSVWSSEQRKAILTHMNLTEAEKAGFYPVFDNYARVVGVLERERLHYIDFHAKHFNNLDETEIQKIFEKVLKMDLEIAKVRLLYHKKFRKVLSMKQANQFASLDETLRTLVRIALQRNTPELALSRAAVYSLNAGFRKRGE